MTAPPKTENRKPKTGINITPGQIRAIKAMARRVFGADDEAYREMLWGQATVRSCKDLKGPKIDLVIRHLQKLLGQGPGARGQGSGETREMRFIRRLWAQVSRAPQGDRNQTLRSFLKARFGVEEVRWLNRDQTWRVIEALKAMRRRTGDGGRGTGDGGQGPGVRE